MNKYYVGRNNQNIDKEEITFHKEYSLEDLPINRYEVQVVDIPLEKEEVYSFYNRGTVLVMGDCNKEIVSWIDKLGLSYKHVPENVYDDKLHDYFDDTVVGILGISKMEWDEGRAYNFVRQMFFSAKHTSELWYKNKIKPFFVVVTRLGGKFGMGNEEGVFVTGSLSGLCKAAAREWMSNVSVHYIDINYKISYNLVAKCIDNEIRYGKEVEVGYLTPSHRIGLRLKERYESKINSNNLNSKDVFLVSGGGKGITAICIKELAKRFKCKFILFGRTKLQEDFNDNYKNLQLEEIREKIIKEKHITGKPIKYSDANSIAKDILAQREIRNTLDELKELGSECLYYSCDVRDQDGVRSIIQQGRKKFGDITGLIHGAGVLSDKLLIKKTEEDFENVFGVKYFGINNMIKEVKVEKIKYIYMFSSIAAFFGNFGQSDYACGNEYLNVFARRWKSRNPNLKIVAINWGPWDAGMPDKALKVAMIRRGKKLIAPDVGKLFFVDSFIKNFNDNDCQIVVNDVNGLGGAL